MEVLSIFILAMAISLDGFVVGITYGLKKIKITFLPILIISIASGVTVLLSMNVGSILAKLISPLWAEKIGGVLLILIGSCLFLNSLDNREDREEIIEESLETKELFSFRIKSLGIIINILREPVRADLDYSGQISKKEAVFLGVALALDAFGAGVGAAMAGYHPYLTAFTVFAFKFLLLTTGVFLGEKIEADRFSDRIKLLPGIILILLGVSKLV